MAPARNTLKTANIDGLDVVSNSLELRRDLHVFVEYVASREVKRAHRNNRLSRADSTRLAKLMTDPDAAQEIKEKGYAGWVGLVDRLALRLGLVDYDTEGEYAGYSSREPSFPDNYIDFKEKKYRSFLRLAPMDREQTLLDAVLNKYEACNNEFFSWATLGRLDPFDGWGCATGVMPSLNFAEIRKFLLLILAAADTRVWHSVASLIQYLKAEHPYFLIPKNPKFKDNWSRKDSRYCNFHESTSDFGKRIEITEDKSDAFERVEGRFVERFLESLPLVFRYVDVAYGKKRSTGVKPSLGELEAFRVHERFTRFMNQDVPEPKVTVQPNFEVHVESLLYPFNTLSELKPLTRLLSEDNVITLALDKRKVADEVAQNEKLDVIALLTELTGRDLPQNVVAELEEWTVHSENFVLFQGFGLLEGDAKHGQDSFIAEEISPNLRIVHSPSDLFRRLERAELVPLHIAHQGRALQYLPDRTNTVFPKEAAEKARSKQKQKQKLTLKRQTLILLHFTNSALLKMVRKAFLDARCPAMADTTGLTLTYDAAHEEQADGVLEALGKEYVVKIEGLAE